MADTETNYAVRLKSPTVTYLHPVILVLEFQTVHVTCVIIYLTCFFFCWVQSLRDADLFAILDDAIPHCNYSIKALCFSCLMCFLHSIQVLICFWSIFGLLQKFGLIFGILQNEPVFFQFTSIAFQNILTQSLTSLGHPTDTGLQLGNACYPCRGKGRGGIFLFLLFLHFHSFSSFSLFHLLYYLFCLSSPLLWETTQNKLQHNPSKFNPKLGFSFFGDFFLNFVRHEKSSFLWTDLNFRET